MRRASYATPDEARPPIRRTEPLDSDLPARARRVHELNQPPIAIPTCDAPWPAVSKNTRSPGCDRRLRDESSRRRTVRRPCSARRCRAARRRTRRTRCSRSRRDRCRRSDTAFPEDRERCRRWHRICRGRRRCAAEHRRAAAGAGRIGRRPSRRPRKRLRLRSSRGAAHQGHQGEQGCANPEHRSPLIIGRDAAVR